MELSAQKRKVPPAKPESSTLKNVKFHYEVEIQTEGLVAKTSILQYVNKNNRPTLIRVHELDFGSRVPIFDDKTIKHYTPRIFRSR